ncbi:pentatricopeptide repeat-containing protein At1g62720-like [Punica granatum]|uniref:Pentatricopeptide repeat-containing protein At1g62720-like n=1 Tax=Punica granatum TaxID=22663 RepID=A0A6P8CYM5_PUNGR|nr:pentatricopeptide repeat-containing protein At1g62720-like [Punica granatum]
MRADMFMDEVRYKCKTGGLRNLDQALSWFHGMIRLRPLPLAADFALLLGVIARPLWPSGLLEKWEGRSSSRVNVVTYNTVVMGLCKEGQLAEAFKLFKKMMDKGVEPTVVTYDTLIHAVCSAEHWEEDGMLSEAESTFDAMIQRGIEPDVVTYNSLIAGYCLQNQMDGYCKGKAMDKAGIIYRDMFQKGLTPDHVTYNIIIGGFCQIGKMQAAEEL